MVEKIRLYKHWKLDSQNVYPFTSVYYHQKNDKCEVLKLVNDDGYMDVKISREMYGLVQNEKNTNQKIYKNT